MGNAQLFLQPQILHHKEHWIGYKNCLFDLYVYLTEITASVAVPNSK